MTSVNEPDLPLLPETANAQENELFGEIAVSYLKQHIADLTLKIISPEIALFSEPKVISPALISNSDTYEFVYPIVDLGESFATTKGFEMGLGGMGNCKLFYTVEKMIALLIERLVKEGVKAEHEVQVSLEGHELAKRKAFESIINLAYNVVIIDYDPGMWGEAYLERVKRFAEMGYGYPPESPRDVYKQLHKTTPTMKQR